MTTVPIEQHYTAEVVTGAKRLQHAHYKRKLGPWPGVITPWEQLNDACKFEYLKMAALFAAAEYLHGNDIDAIVNEIENGYNVTPGEYDRLTMLNGLKKRYAEYQNHYLDRK